MKKKLLLTFVFLLVILYSVGIKEAKAVDVTESSCITRTNYYLFLEATYSSVYDDMFVEKGDPFTIITQPEIYSLVLPNGAEIVAHGNVAFAEKDTTSTITLENFHNKWINTKESEVYTVDNGITNYLRSSIWFENGELHTGGVDVPTDYSVFSKQVLGDYGNTKITIIDKDGNQVTNPLNEEGTIWFNAERTIYKSEVEKLGLNSNVNIFSPGVYYIQYEVCPEDINYDVTVHYMDKSNNKELFNSVVQEELPNGSAYNSYTCPDTLDDYASYSLNKNEIYQHDAGVINGENVDLYCNYDKKATLTINFGTDNDCSEGTNIRTSETVDYIVGQNIEYSIPNINEYEFSNVGFTSPTFSLNVNDNKLAFDMPNKNTSICLVYIKNPQTGVEWIYFAWVIGIVALAYSGWYFMKYYKNRNNEI